MPRRLLLSLAAVLCLAAPAAAATPGGVAPITGHPCLTPSGGVYDSGTGITCDAAPWSGFYPRVGLDYAMSGDGAVLYLVDYDHGRLIYLNRDAATGALSDGGCGASPATTGCDPIPRSVVGVDTYENDVYAAGDSTISALRRQAGGHLALTGCVSESHSGGCEPTSGLRYNNAPFAAPDGKQVYATGGTANVFVFQRDATTGGLSSSFGLCKGAKYVNEDSTSVDCDNAAIRGVGPTIYGLYFSPDGKSVYANGQSGVAIFDRDPSTGALAQKAGTAGCIVDYAGSNPDGCLVYPLLSQPTALTVAPDGKTVYAATHPAGYYALVRIPRDTATGALNPDASAAGCYGPWPSVAGEPCTALAPGFDYPQRIVVAPGGAYAYTLHSGSTGGRVQALRRDPANGALSLVPGTDGCLSSSGGTDCSAHHMAIGQMLVMDPSGQNLYAGADYSQDAGILELAITPDASWPPPPSPSPPPPPSPSPPPPGTGPADTASPQITITTPRAGETFTQGAPVTARYTCTDETAIASCTPQGVAGHTCALAAKSISCSGPLPTGTLGRGDFRVVARDRAGHETNTLHGYFVKQFDVAALAQILGDVTKAVSDALKQAPKIDTPSHLAGQGVPATVTTQKPQTEVRTTLIGTQGANHALLDAPKILNGAGIISDNGLGIISDNGLGIISDNGLGLKGGSYAFVGSNGAGIISDNGLGIVSRAVAAKRLHFVSIGTAKRLFKRPSKGVVRLRLSKSGRAALRRRTARRGRQTVRLLYAITLVRRTPKPVSVTYLRSFVVRG